MLPPMAATPIQPATYSWLGHNYGNADVSAGGTAHFGDVVNNYYQSTEAAQSMATILMTSLTFARMGARLRNVTTASPTTCEWLFENTEFQTWIDDSKLDSHHGFFWIKGKPGSGKSTIMKKALAWTEQRWHDQVRVSYFFNARSPDLLEKSTLGLYRSLVHQILSSSPALHIPFVEMFKMKQRNTQEIQEPWTETELQSFLTDYIALCPPLIMFIDALDEGHDEEVQEMVMFFETLAYHANAAGKSFRICLSSRHYPHILIRYGLSIVVEDQPGHYQDLKAYIQSVLPKVETQAMRDLQARILDLSKGIFLWVVVVLPMLVRVYRQGKGIRAMNQKLEGVPHTVHDLFASILLRDPTDIDECFTLLRWMLYSLTPLQFTELYTAVQQSHLPTSEDPNTAPDAAEKKRYLLHTSRGLLEIIDAGVEETDCHRAPEADTDTNIATDSDEDDEYEEERKWHASRKGNGVQFIHQSVRDYLTGTAEQSQPFSSFAHQFPVRPSFAYESSHADLAETCLKYLIRLCKETCWSHKLVAMWPLARYAAAFWWQHMSRSGDSCSASVISMASSFLQSPQSELVKWVQLFDIDYKYASSYDFGQFQNLSEERVAHGLYYAAMLNLPRLLPKMLAVDKSDLNRKGGKFGTALQAAAYFGREEVTKSLLEAGADPNVFSQIYGTALDIAALRGHNNVVRKLLDGGAEVNTKGGFNGTALFAACSQGHVDVLKTLLHASVSVNTRGRFGQTALVGAVEGGHAEVVQILLDAGADVNGRGEGEQSALQVAAAYGLPNIIRILLNAGADVNQRDGTDDTPLILASTNDHVDIIKLLLKAGADARMVGKRGNNALTAPTYYQDKNFDEGVDALLNAGADPNHRNSLGLTPLMRASAGANVKVVQKLLAVKADLSVINNRGTTALHDVLNRSSVQFPGRLEVLKLLLDYGASLGYNNQERLGSVLWEVAHNTTNPDALVAARTLIEYGANPNFETRKDMDLKDPLSVALRVRNKDMVELLVRAGAKLESRKDRVVIEQLLGGPPMAQPVGNVDQYLLQSDVEQRLLD